VIKYPFKVLWKPREQSTWRWRKGITISNVSMPPAADKLLMVDTRRKVVTLVVVWRLDFCGPIARERVIGAVMSLPDYEIRSTFGIRRWYDH
jgi:hypothetical protein